MANEGPRMDASDSNKGKSDEMDNPKEGSDGYKDDFEGEADFKIKLTNDVDDEGNKKDFEFAHNKYKWLKG